MNTLRPCYLSNLLIEERSEQQVIFIRERNGERRIPIVVGPYEAAAIDRAVKGSSFPRPLTHDLFVNLIALIEHSIKEVRIVDLREGTFYAELLIGTPDGREVVLDCRPSDAIAIMVRLPGVALLVAEDVLAEST